LSFVHESATTEIYPLPYTTLFRSVDEDAGEGGLPAGLRVEGRDAHEPVHARLRLEKAVGVFSADDQRRALDTGLFARIVVGDLHLPAPLLGVPGVHAHEHGRPVHGLGPARPGVDLQDGVAPILWAGEHGAKLEVADRRLDGVEVLLHLAGRLLVALLLGELEQR